MVEFIRSFGKTFRTSNSIPVKTIVIITFDAGPSAGAGHDHLLSPGGHIVRAIWVSEL
jgi:hypothetical protein